MTHASSHDGGHRADGPRHSSSTSSSPGSRARGSAGGRFRNADGSRPWYIEIPLLIIIALLISFLVQTFLGRVYRIPSESMEPTLIGCDGCNGDRIIVDKVTYHFSDPRPGDVVVFRGPDSWNEGYSSIRSSNPVLKAVENVGSVVGLVPPDENTLVKRVIAVGGQTVGGCGPQGEVMVDGKPVQDQGFINTPQQSRQNPMNCNFGPVTVPEGNVWVMGDNRSNSADSRYHMGDENQGTVPVDNIVGKVRWIILPLGRMGSVDSPDLDALSGIDAPA